MGLHSLQTSIHEAQSAASDAYRVEQGISLEHNVGGAFHDSRTNLFSSDAEKVYKAGLDAEQSSMPDSEKGQILGDLAATLEEMVKALWEQAQNAIWSAWSTGYDSFNSGQQKIYDDHIQIAISDWMSMAELRWPDVDFDDYVREVEFCYDPAVWGRAFSDTTDAPLAECEKLQAEAEKLQEEANALNDASDVVNTFDVGLEGDAVFEDLSGELAIDESLVAREIEDRAVAREMAIEERAMAAEEGAALAEEGLALEEGAAADGALAEGEGLAAEEGLAGDAAAGEAIGGEILTGVEIAGEFL